jgi:NAD+ diphosphatase
LAGFVEAGETFERAVLREAWEETGVQVDLESVKYLASQPWPFPRSTMIGFRATADHTKPMNIDHNELVDALWFSKEDVRVAAQIAGPTMKKEFAEKVVQENLTLPVLIPPKGVLARRLIDNWLEDAT